jgi:hypothetical protein
MSGLRVSAVVVGLVIDFVASVVGGMVWGAVVGFRAASQGLPPEAVAEAPQLPVWYRVASFLAVVPAAMLGASTVARAPLAKPALA